MALPAGELGHIAARPRCSALHSQRAVLLPTLDDALARYVRSRQEAAVNDAALAAGCIAAPGQGSEADGAGAVADLAQAISC